MNDADLFKERYASAKSPLDDELLRTYCSGIEERIRSAENAEAAKLVVDDACREFEAQCESEIIPMFLTRHVRHLFEKYWGER